MVKKCVAMYTSTKDSKFYLKIRGRKKKTPTFIEKQTKASLKKLQKSPLLLPVFSEIGKVPVDVSFINVSILKEEQCHPKAAHSRLH